MKKILFKIAAVLLAVLMLVSVFGCGKDVDETENTSAEATNAVTEPATEPATGAETDTQKNPESKPEGSETKENTFRDVTGLTLTFESSTLSLSGSTTVDVLGSDLYAADYSVFNNRLAKFNFIMCMNSLGDFIKVKGETGDKASLCTYLGFTDPVQIYVGGDKVTENQDDKTSFFVSYLSGYYDGKKQIYVNVTVSPTDSTNMQEWSSNFDIGCESSALYTGSTTDWTTYENHKGFDVAATRVIAALLEYFKTIDGFADSTVTVGFNGYSRGAAIANILAAKFNTEDFKVGDNAKCYAYTFATPLTTVSETASSYKNIFNIVNADDLVTSLPPASLGFVRYGTDVSFDISTDETLKNAYKTLTGSAFNNTAMKDLITAFNGVCTSREEFYAMPTSSDAINTLQFSTYAQAEKKRNDLVTFFTGLCPTDTDKYVSISAVTSGAVAGKYTVTYSFAPVVFTKLLPTVMAGQTSGGTTNFTTLLGNFSFGRYTPLLTAMVKMYLQNSAGLTNMHYPSPYFVYIESLK